MAAWVVTLFGTTLYDDYSRAVVGRARRRRAAAGVVGMAEREARLAVGWEN